MAKVCMWLSDTPPRNGQVSGSEMLTNLKGSPYEKFSMWVCQRDKMRKYGQPGGGALDLKGCTRAVAEYLGKEMTAIGERQVQCAHQFHSERAHKRAQRDAERARRQATPEHDDFEYGLSPSRSPQKALTPTPERPELPAPSAEYTAEHVEAAIQIQSVYRSHASRDQQQAAHNAALAGHGSSPPRAGASLSGTARLPLVLPQGLVALRCLCFSATSTLSELILPTVGAKAAHGIEALQAFVAVRRERLGEDHAETCLFVEQLVLACSCVGLLHAMAGDVEASRRFLGPAEQALQTSGVTNAVASELKLVLYSVQCQLACMRQEQEEALRFAELAHHEATRGEDEVGEAGAAMLLAHVHSVFGDFRASREILEAHTKP